MGNRQTFEHYNHLNSATAYYLDDQGAQYTWDSFAESAKHSRAQPLRLDEAAVYGVVLKNYPLANRTLAAGISRVPWLCKPEGGEWVQADLPKHGSEKASAEDIAAELESRLYQELCQFVRGKSVIAVLLSGGMDSRVVAATLRKMQEGGDFSGQVVAFTWGLESSRDVIYSKKIASLFNWEFQHFPVSAEQVFSNISFAAELGAEFSPIHLHAMPAVATHDGIDGVIAGSYGDSIGRGEYSGRKINDLPFILDKNLNRFSLLRSSVETTARAKVLRDVLEERGRFPGRTEAAYREIDLQMHYMRRQLNSCFAVIDRRIPVYQAFSSPAVFGYMWSLHPECRNDKVYEQLLRRAARETLSVPWARTGTLYNNSGGKELDRHASLHHRYGQWLRNDCRQAIVDEILSGQLQSLGVFNESSLAMWCRWWSTGKSAKADRLDEKMAWLATLSKYVRLYDIQPAALNSAYSLRDSLRCGYALAEYKLYRSALKLRK